MTIKIDSRLIWLVAAVLVAASSGFILGYAVQAGFWSQEAAAWVQAVGSIGAIFAAAAIAHTQGVGAEAIRRADKLAAIEARFQPIAALAELAVRSIPSHPFPDEHGNSGFNSHLVKDLADALGAVALHQVNDVRLLRALVDLRRSLDGLISNHDACQGDLKRHGGIHPDRTDAMLSQHRAIVQAEGIIRMRVHEITLHVADPPT